MNRQNNCCKSNSQILKQKDDLISKLQSENQKMKIELENTKLELNLIKLENRKFDKVAVDELLLNLIKENDNTHTYFKTLLKKPDIVHKDIEVLINLLTKEEQCVSEKVICFEQLYKCNICSVQLPPTWEIDLIKPIYKGGCNERKNLQVLCSICHFDKTETEISSLYYDICYLHRKIRS